MFIDTFPRSLDFWRVNLLGVPRNAVWEDDVMGRGWDSPSVAGAGGKVAPLSSSCQA